MRTAALVLAFLACASRGRRLQHWSTQPEVLSHDENDDSQKALTRLLQAISPTSGYQLSGAGRGISPTVSHPSTSTLKVQAATRSDVDMAGAVAGDEEIPEKMWDADSWKKGGVEIVYFNEESRKNIKEGLHRDRGRFFQCQKRTLDNAIILSVAGAYPGIRAEQVKSPIVLPHSPPGKFTFHILSSEASPSGIVTMIDEDSLISKWHPNSVVIVCQRDSLGMSGPKDEVLAVVDRGDIAVTDPSLMEPKEFYAFADAEGLVHIRWLEEIPAGWSVLGRILLVQLPYYPESKVKTGFAELDDGFVF